MQERLQKILSSAGIASRRAAEEMILRGEVTVNGKRVLTLGSKADPGRDHIKVRGKLIRPSASSSEKTYLLLNKPRGYLSSVSDPKRRPLVMDLIPASIRRGLHPVGRLDFNTEGLIVLTNDGDLTRIVTQAGAVAKVYHVKVKGAPTDAQIERLRRGVVIAGSRTAPAQIDLLNRHGSSGNTWYEVTLVEGKNKQIRRMFDSIGHSVTKLRRVRIGHLDGSHLKPGQYRELTRTEVNRFFTAASSPVRNVRPASRSPRRARK